MKIGFEKKTVKNVLHFPTLPIAKDKSLFLHLHLLALLYDLKKSWPSKRELEKKIKIWFQRLKHGSIT